MLTKTTHKIYPLTLFVNNADNTNHHHNADGKEGANKSYATFAFKSRHYRKNYNAYNSAPPACKGSRYRKNCIHKNRASDFAEKGTEAGIQKAKEQA